MNSAIKLAVKDTYHASCPLSPPSSPLSAFFLAFSPSSTFSGSRVFGSPLRGEATFKLLRLAVAVPTWCGF